MKKSPLALLLTLGLLNTPFSAFAATAPLDLVGPVSDYKIYVTEQLDQLGSHTQQFTDAVKKGDLATAQKLYAPTRVYYESIEPSVRGWRAASLPGRPVACARTAARRTAARAPGTANRKY